MHYQTTEEIEKLKEEALSLGIAEDEFDCTKYLDLLPLYVEQDKSVLLQLTEAIHLIQSIFMWRFCIRQTQGQYWLKISGQGYDNDYTLITITPKTEYIDCYENLQEFYTSFLTLDIYHPSHKNDIIRGLNIIFEVISESGC